MTASGGFTYTVIADTATTRLAEQSHQFRAGEGIACLVKFDRSLDSIIKNQGTDTDITGHIHCSCGSFYEFKMGYEFSGSGAKNCPKCGKQTHIGTVHGSRAPVGDDGLLVTVVVNRPPLTSITIESISGGVDTSSRQTSEEVLRCSFCSKSQNDVKKLIGGPNVHICDECIDVCNEIIADDSKAENATSAKHSTPTQNDTTSAAKQPLFTCPSCGTECGVVIVTQDKTHQSKEAPDANEAPTPSKITSTKTVTVAQIEHLQGPSSYWRCPLCQGVLQKSDPIPGLSRYDSVQGSVTCGGCGHVYSRDVIYSGKYDLPEVKLTCPHCSTLLKGPGESLLGKPCPSCAQRLPKG
jgi:hypothetical protein